MPQVIKHKSGLEIRRLAGKNDLGESMEMRFDKVGPDRVVVARTTKGKDRVLFFTGDTVQANDFYQECLKSGWVELDRDINSLGNGERTYEFELVKHNLVQMILRDSDDRILSVDHVTNHAAEEMKDYLLSEGWQILS